jgi:hypothetical protein
VVEAAREVVRDELFVDADLIVGLAGSGNNRRRLPPMGCLRRKTTAGELPLPGLVAGAVGRFLAQEGHGDGALLLVWSNNLEVTHRRLEMAGKVAINVEQSSEEQRSNSGRGERNGWWPLVVTSRHMDKGASPHGAVTTGGHRRRVAFHVVSMATWNRVARGTG